MRLLNIIAVLFCIMLKDAASATSRPHTTAVMVTEQATLPSILPNGHLICPNAGDKLFLVIKPSGRSTPPPAAYAFFCCNNATPDFGFRADSSGDRLRPPYSCRYYASSASLHRHPDPSPPPPAATDEWVDPPPP